MALNVSAVRGALAHVIDVAFGTEIQVATAGDGVTRPPTILIDRPTVRYHQAMARGLDSMEFPIYGIMPRTHDQAVVDFFDELLSGTGARSLLTIIEADKTLDGACQTLVTRDAVADIWPSTNGDLPAYQWTVEVYG